MTHNSIQDSCSGPDFALGEVYGLRQWTMQRASAYRRTYGLPAGTHPFTASVSLTGHFSTNWALKSNKAECRASQSFSHRLHVSPDYPPTAYLDIAAKESAHPDIYLIDVMLKWAENILRADGIEPRDVHRLEINGGRRGGMIIATANWVLNKLMVTYSDLGTLVHDGSGRFTDKDSGHTSARYYDEDFSDWGDINSIMVPGIIEYAISYTANADCDSIAQPKCTCGFYAYNNIDSLVGNSYTSDNSVFGLIRGYGKVTIGTKGFRAEKADIVALAEPVAFRRTGTPSAPTSHWYSTSYNAEHASLLHQALESTDIQIFDSPEKLFDFSRVHTGES